MTSNATVGSYRLMLCRDTDGAMTATRFLVHATPISIAAGSESRAPADVRRLGIALGDRFPSLETIEALCRFDGGDGDEAPAPGLILLDRRFPIWIALLEQTVLVTIDTELLDGDPRARVQRAHEVIEVLRASGHRIVVDVQADRVDTDGISEGDLASRLAAAGSTRWFGLLTRDARFGFGFGGIGFAIATAVIDRWDKGTWPPVWTSAVDGLFFGLFMAAVQYWHARKRLTERLDGMRDEIVSGRTEAPRAWRKSRIAIAGDVAGLVVFGSFATIGLISRSWAIGLFIAAFWAAAVASVAVGFGRVLKIDSESIEACSPFSRTRIAFRDVLQVRQWPALDLTIVSSDRDWLLIPNGFDERGQLTITLWDRVLGALREPSLQQVASGAEILPSLHETEERRRGRRILRDVACPPLWLLVRRHPLLGQYLWQHRLLRRGRLALARVVAANRVLYRVPRDEGRFDAPAIVIYTFDAADNPQWPGLLDRIATRLTDSHDTAAEWFTNAVTEGGGFPFAVLVPESFTEGVPVCCTTVMVVRRHIPLGSLRAQWLPLLVSPTVRFSVVLPLRFWSTGMCAAWKRDNVTPD